MDLSLVDAPSVEPITLALAKLQLKRGDVSEEDTLISGLIQAVRQRAERETNRALITQTWDLLLDAFPCDRVIMLPKPPLQSVTSVTYYDATGTLQTLSSTTAYEVTTPSGPQCARGRVALRTGEAWPTTQDRVHAVTVRFVCGYGDTPATVPGDLRAAMQMDLAALYVDRENVIAEGSKVHRIYWGNRSHETQRRAA